MQPPQRSPLLNLKQLHQTLDPSKTMKRLGYIEDAPSDRDHVPLFGAIPARPGDLTPWMGAPFNQAQTSTCVAQAIVKSISIREAKAGRKSPQVSRLYGYYYARKRLNTESQMSGDHGCRPRDALDAFRLMGSPPETAWPFELSRLNKRPSQLIQREGVDLTFEYKRCRFLGEARMALAQGHPVIVGFMVDEYFMDGRGPDVITDFDKDRILGGHMGTLVKDDPEREELTLLNSYGPNWRQNGTVRVTYKLVQKHARDLWAIV